MANVNRNRVIAGGILAGIIIDASEALINGVILKQDWADAMTKLGKSPDLSAGMLAAFNMIGLIVGIVTVWLYAAIRSRYGAGPKTAIMAALTIWIIGYAIPAVGQAGMGLVTTRMTAIATGLGLVEILLAAVAGAAVYKEAEAPITRSATA